MRTLLDVNVLIAGLIGQSAPHRCVERDGLRLTCVLTEARTRAAARAGRCIGCCESGRHGIGWRFAKK